MTEACEIQHTFNPLSRLLTAPHSLFTIKVTFNDVKNDSNCTAARACIYIQCKKGKEYVHVGYWASRSQVVFFSLTVVVVCATWLHCFFVVLFSSAITRFTAKRFIIHTELAHHCLRWLVALASPRRRQCRVTGNRRVSSERTATTSYRTLLFRCFSICPSAKSSQVMFPLRCLPLNPPVVSIPFSSSRTVFVSSLQLERPLITTKWASMERGNKLT